MVKHIYAKNSVSYICIDTYIQYDQFGSILMYPLLSVVSSVSLIVSSASLVILKFLLSCCTIVANVGLLSGFSIHVLVISSYLCKHGVKTMLLYNVI